MCPFIFSTSHILPSISRPFRGYFSLFFLHFLCTVLCFTTRFAEYFIALTIIFSLLSLHPHCPGKFVVSPSNNRVHRCGSIPFCTPVGSKQSCPVSKCHLYSFFFRLRPAVTARLKMFRKRSWMVSLSGKNKSCRTETCSSFGENEGEAQV